MSFLQTAGIASQASDHYDDQRQDRRLKSQKERAGNNALYEDEMFRRIIQMAYAHEAQKDAAKKAVQAPRRAAIAAPVAPGLIDQNAVDAAEYASSPMIGGDSLQFGRQMANGGPVEEKFNGIYDDMKVGARLPTIFKEHLADVARNGAAYTGRGEQVIADIVRASNTRAMANGGMVGGKEDKRCPKTIYKFVKHRMGMRSAVKPVKKMAGGGMVRGPGSGVSDSVPAVGPAGPIALSNGEYVLSADTVRAVGKHNLDALQARHHRKV